MTEKNGTKFFCVFKFSLVLQVTLFFPTSTLTMKQEKLPEKTQTAVNFQPRHASALFRFVQAYKCLN